MIKQYKCEICGEYFKDEQVCLEHENNCGKTIIHNCSKCGKKESYDSKSNETFIIENQWHNFDLGKLGYGSKLDGCHIDFEICDDCLVDLIDSFTESKSESIYSSESGFTSSYYYYDD